MKTILHHRGVAAGPLRSIQLCSATKAIEIAGQVFVPDAATAYIEFFMAHSFPLYLDRAEPGERPDYTTLHPRVIASSYRSLVGKPINLAHLIKAYNPDLITKDHVFGTVMAAEFPETPEGGWRVQNDPAAAPCIRAVAALHKNLEGVNVVIDTWDKGVTPFSETPWVVSMENESYIETGGFLVEIKTGGNGYYDVRNTLEVFIEQTPEEFKSLGWCYVPYKAAPADLLACLREGDMLGLKDDFRGCKTLFLNGGLDGKIFFFGVGLVPAGRQSAARVGRIYASADGLIDLTGIFGPIADFANKIAGKS